MLQMQAASRESLAAVTDRFDEVVAGSDGPTLDTLAAELGAVTDLLTREVVLRKHLCEPTASTRVKQELLDRLLGGKVSDTSLQVLRAAVAQRWSKVRDFVTAVEYFGRQAALHSAERANVVEEVEDELFRFGRVLDGEGRLASLLSDDTTDPAGRVRLLDEVLGQRVRPQTRALLEQAVRTPRGRDLAAAATELAELTAARRQETVAHVTAAAPLSAEQQERLTRVLAGIYRRTISLQVEVDPQVLGGLLVRVGDEVIDGSIASKLARANQDLPN